MGTGEMAQWSRAFSAVLENWSLDPSTHAKQLTNACNSSSKGSDISFGLYGHLNAQTHTQTDMGTQMHTHTHTHTPFMDSPGLRTFAGIKENADDNWSSLLTFLAASALPHLPGTLCDWNVAFPSVTKNHTGLSCCFYLMTDDTAWQPPAGRDFQILIERPWGRGRS